jgi:hypothetical protein
MSPRSRRAVDIFNLSFLDVVSCGFGAIILLLVIVKVSEPRVVEQLAVDLSAMVQRLTVEDGELRDQATALDDALAISRQRLSTSRDRLQRLQAEAAARRDQVQAARRERDAQKAIGERLETAAQTLSEELRRLLGADYRRAAGAAIGGVPVDSEYIVFIIDTSGSMQQNAWPLVLEKVRQVLAIYPQVKGIQVMNDMGDYMFSQYAGRWIPDTPARRKAINARLAGWTPFSNSSPVEGIEAAIRRFYAADKRISLYVFGDDFSRGSIQNVIDTVARLNRSDASGRGRVRIHAVGFPVLLAGDTLSINAVRFAALMRKLAENNNGSFVGLNSTLTSARQ